MTTQDDELMKEYRNACTAMGRHQAISVLQAALEESLTALEDTPHAALREDIIEQFEDTVARLEELDEQ